MTFRESFSRDLTKVKDREVPGRVRRAIERVEAAGALQEVGHLKKLNGTGTFYRIRLGE